MSMLCTLTSVSKTTHTLCTLMIMWKQHTCSVLCYYVYYDTSQMLSVYNNPSDAVSCHLYWPSLALIGPHWLPLAITGPHWPSLAFTGLHWPSLALVGPHWASLALTGPHWPSLTLIGPHWPSMALTGPHWPSLVLTGPYEVPVVNAEALCAHMAIPTIRNVTKRR